MSEKRYTLGIDTGSTTVKVAILNAENALLFLITGVTMPTSRRLWQIF